MTPLPALPPQVHDQLIRALLTPQADLPAIAASFNLTLLQLAGWFNLPETQAAIGSIREMARARAQLLADLKLPAAVETLQRINDNLAGLQAHPEAPLTLHLRLADTARRTATAIQRMATPRSRAGAISGATTRGAAAFGDGEPPQLPLPEGGSGGAERAIPPLAPPSTHARDRPATAAAA